MLTPTVMGHGLHSLTSCRSDGDVAKITVNDSQDMLDIPDIHVADASQAGPAIAEVE